MLVLSRNSDDRWNALGLPPRIARGVRERVDRLCDYRELHELADALEAEPLSNWDLEIYTIHGFGDNNDPYDWVLETVEKRRFVEFLKWLSTVLSVSERQTLVESANSLRVHIENTKHYPELGDPVELV